MSGWAWAGLAFLILVIGAQAQQSNELRKQLNETEGHLEATGRVAQQYRKAFEALAIHHKELIEVAAVNPDRAKLIALLWLSGRGMEKRSNDTGSGGDRVLSA
jgi:hypothetical protein